MLGAGKRSVYLLRSDSDPARHLVNVTSDVHNRLKWQNHGPCWRGVEHRPWSVAVDIEFSTEGHALRFERCLKCGAGRVFLQRHRMCRFHPLVATGCFWEPSRTPDEALLRPMPTAKAPQVS
jgi:hypothetical protein